MQVDIYAFDFPGLFSPIVLNHPYCLLFTSPCKNPVGLTVPVVFPLVYPELALRFSSISPSPIDNRCYNTICIVEVGWIV